MSSSPELLKENSDTLIGLIYPWSMECARLINPYASVLWALWQHTLLLKDGKSFRK